MEAPGQLPGILSLGLRSLSMRCVYTWSNVSAEPFWQDEVRCKCWAILARCVYTWSDVSVVPFWQDGVGCKCRSFSMQCDCTWLDTSADTFWRDVFTHGRCECWVFLTRWGQMWVLGMPFWQDEVRCKSWAGHSNLSVRYKRWWRPTWRVGLQDWFCRTSCDEKNQRDSTNDDDDPDLMMIQI